jgi:hypothetical protein
MSAYYDALIAKRDALVAQLAAIESETPTYNVDGQSVTSPGDDLLTKIERINKLIAEADGNSSFTIFSAADTP